jgi:hypothetical protein
MMIGNSSSGLVEAPSFGLPVVNIGDRQKGRIRARNVIDVPCQTQAIAAGIRQARTYDRSVPCRNPYGDGRSSARVREFLQNAFSVRTREDILRKRFVDLPAGNRRNHIGGPMEVPFEVFTAESSQNPDDYFHLNGRGVWLNSGRAAFRFILDRIRLEQRKILIPDYLCGDVLVPVLKGAGVSYGYYSIDGDMSANLDDIRRQLNSEVGAILFINYFGLFSQESAARAIKAEAPDLVVIQDDVQAVYEPHFVAQENHWADYVFTSFRKFFPLPDGAFVRSSAAFPEVPAVPSVPSRGAFHYVIAGALKSRFISGEGGTAAESTYLSYFQEADAQVTAVPNPMTWFSREFLRKVPLEKTRHSRRLNYSELVRELKGLPGFSILHPALDEREVPLALPILLKDARQRDNLRTFLNDRNIFCPVHWPLIPEVRKRASPVVALSDRILSLPIDQRYGPGSLGRLADAVLEFREAK